MRRYLVATTKDALRGPDYVNEFYKKGCQAKKLRLELGGARLFLEDPAPLCFVIREEVWPVIHSRTVFSAVW